MTNPMTIRPAVAEDIPALAAIADATLFPGDMLADMLAPFLEGASDQRWWVIAQGAPIGFAFTMIEPMTEQSWNLKAIAIAPDHHRRGAGTALLQGVETELRAAGARVLVVDTSSAEDQAAARALYLTQGYDQAGLIQDFWEVGQDKVTFCKSLS